MDWSLRRSFWHFAAGVAVCALVGGPLRDAAAAETVTETPKTTTQIILSLDTSETIQVRTHLEPQPPVVVIEFPSQPIAASLPERSIIRNGVVSEIQTRYRSTGRRGPLRAIESLRVALTGPYAHRVRATPGHVVLEIEHPAEIRGESIEVGLRGGTILRGLARRPVSERFRVMEEALAKASPATWTWRADGSPEISAGLARGTEALRASSAEAVSPRVNSAQAPRASKSRAPSGRDFRLLLMLLGLAGLLWWLPGGTEALRAAARWLSGRFAMRASLGGGESFVEDLVWKAFERQGYQLIRTIRPSHAKGAVRIIAREGTKSALQCLVNGPFFEKQSVEQFIQVMRQASIEQGFLVVSGSFTVPAQRRAKEANVTLVGRGELVELLSAGAMTEYFAMQLEHLQAKLDEAKEALHRSGQELDTYRRQRNEASWYLGEERARRAKFESDASGLAQQLRHAELTSEQAQKEAATLRRQWEESQWFLGEAKSRIRYLENQITQLQAIAQSVESAQRDRDAVIAQSAEQRIHAEQLTAQLEALTSELKQSVVREQALRDQLRRYQEELAALQTHGERRRVTRGPVSQAVLELQDRRRQVVFSGSARNLSGGGVGFETDRAGTIGELLRLSLRLPGRTDPITSRARLVWQQRDLRSATYRSGCRFIGLADEDRALIEGAIGLSPS